ncbi:MAG: hypothetical protein ACM34O_09500 [Ignavibacteria bacterium]
METVTITAAINEKKKVEFYQTMESLKILIKSYCNKIDAEIDQGNNLVIRITFNSKEEMEQNFSNAEFNILKGSVRSLCENVRININ